MKSLLAVLETLEAAQLNLGLYHTHVTTEDLCRHLEEQEGESLPLTDIETSLRALVAQGEAIEWRPGFFRSRIAETVRCLRLLRQRLWWHKDLSDSALLVEDVRVEFRQRRRPKRDTVTVSDALPPDLPGEITAAFQAAIAPIATFSGFQVRAIQEVLACAGRGNPDNESFIIAGDTGAGKTEAFLFPILLDIATEPPELRERPGVRAVLVYPRIRLARNQLRRLLLYTGKFQEAGGPRLTVGIQNGDVPADLKEMQNDRKWSQKTENGRIWYRQDNLLETCVACGAGQVWVVADDPAIETGCPRLVCDRCGHVVDTLCITQTALERNAPDNLIITDVSLSQWLAREKYTHLWGLWEGDTITVPPRFLVLDEVHLYERIKGAHIARLIKRFQARVKLVYQQTQQPIPVFNPLVIGVSATLHDEQQFLAKLLDVDPQDQRAYNRLRVIKPKEDELEPTEGRERYIFIYPRRLSPTPRSPQYRVNDQAAAIQIVMTAMHNLKTEPEWRGLAFFDSINDLRQFRHNYDADPSLQWYVGRDPTGKEIPTANQDELWRIRTDRRPTKGQASNIRSQCKGGCEQRMHDATLYQCPHFQSGDCWVFAKQNRGWNDPLYVADSVYAGAASQLDGQDLIPTSPSLEVGYDDDAIHLIYQHKAPPSAASFIQRRGRAGRNPNDSPVIITLLWPYRRDDAFYFFHPEALYDPSFDDLPLNAGNFNVQRTHALLAFFDLLACLRRQNLDGIADDPRIVDFTSAGWSHFMPGDEVIQSIRGKDDPVRGRQLIVKHRETRQDVWFSGEHLTGRHVIEQNNGLKIRGWLLMDKGLSTRVLLPAWKRLQHLNAEGKTLLSAYLSLSEIASAPFQQHRTYPFLTPGTASLPVYLLRQFGNKDYHSSNDAIERGNWLKTYKYIAWMLQDNEEATTLTIHYPNPEYGATPEEPVERTTDVTFGLTELLPGNVSYRLREKQTIHWTPISKDGVSTFLYPEEDVLDDAGAIIGRKIAFPPEKGDITSKPDSIFGVPRYLDARFPGLPFMTVNRLRVKMFGPPDRQYSPLWFYDPDKKQAVRLADGEEPVSNLLPISRRSSARADSVIIPYIPGKGSPLCRSLLPPLDSLFAAIEGFLEEGQAMLGYTRVFYEMQIDIKTNHKKRDALGIRPEDLTLHRLFYDETGQRTLVGYAIETQGIRFQVNPDLLAQTAAAILADEDLRLHLRRNFAIYRMAPHAAEWEVFIKTHLDMVAVLVDYWLHQVVPGSSGEPRLLNCKDDYEAILSYHFSHRIVRPEDVQQEFKPYLTERFFVALNKTLEVAFKESPEFHDFVDSVVLHSLSALLKNLVARLGGVGSDDLVAYADLPVLDQVDRSIDPRILIMDTVAGGSGGIAQAFERLDLTDNEGSLWWTLQTELGHCPIAIGEALVCAVLTRATPAQMTEAQADISEKKMEDGIYKLLSGLGLDNPAPAALRVLGRTLTNTTEVGGQPINPALIMQELFALQQTFEAQTLGDFLREATVRRAVAASDPAQQPQIAMLREALRQSGVPADTLDHELALQLHVLFESGCDDGCPVCLSADSDIEHYHLAPLLNSRRALKKLREVLLISMPTGDCLAALADSLLAQTPVHVQANPGGLGNQLNPTLGLGIVNDVGEDGQIQGASAVMVNTDHARDLVADGRWEERWGGEEHRRIETPNGIYVRSRAEYIIATRLWHAGIHYHYELPLPYTDDAGRARAIHPDFYLYEHNLYVEYWGRDDPEYLESRRFKEQVYAQRGIAPVNIEKDEVDNGAFMEKIQARMAASGN